MEHTGFAPAGIYRICEVFHFFIVEETRFRSRRRWFRLRRLKPIGASHAELVVGLLPLGLNPKVFLRFSLRRLIHSHGLSLRECIRERNNADYENANESLHVVLL